MKYEIEGFAIRSHTEGIRMNNDEKKNYIAATSAKLKALINGKLAEISAAVLAEAKLMYECSGREAVDMIQCAVDCTYDQVNSAIDEWNLPSGSEFDGQDDIIGFSSVQDPISDSDDAF